MRRLIAFLVAAAALPVAAQTSVESYATRDAADSGRSAPTAPRGDYDVDAAPAYYVTARDVAVRESPVERSPVLTTLQMRDGVRVLAEDGPPADGFAAGWRLVQYGAVRGYVRAAELSNLWIRVDKSERMVYVYRGAELIRELPADVSISAEDKTRRSALGEGDHYRMPEGTFFVTRLNDQSSYYRAFVISYPGPSTRCADIRTGSSPRTSTKPSSAPTRRASSRR